MENYPVYIDGAQCGSMQVYSEGLMTVFDAECRCVDRLVWLRIFGGGKSAALGVMQPEKGRLRLVKKLSRAQMRILPQVIEYAADKPFAPIKQPDISEDDGLLWFSTPQGFLTCFDGRRSLIAIPADMSASTRTKAILRTINGREYAVFPGKRNFPGK